MTTNRTVELEDTVVAARNQVAAEVGGEIVILNVTSGEYFALSAVGARIWALIEQPRCVRDVRDQLLREYVDVDEERCTDDLLALLREMYSEELLEVLERPPA